MRYQVLLLVLFFAATVSAQIMHPAYRLLDDANVPVQQSGRPISTMNTCGTCHDTEYITTHSYHSDIGFSTLSEPGAAPSGRSWDFGTGLYGRWNPMVYRYLSPGDDVRLDLTPESWIQIFGARHVGGGPTARATDNPTIEMNCFLCHTEQPNNEARKTALAEQKFSWANTATLHGTGVVKPANGSWSYARDAFNPDGTVKLESLTPQDPTNENCGLCHGLVHSDREAPLITTTCQPEFWMTETSGQIISPQRLSDSGLNLARKSELSRAWDVHAERVVNCVDCHYSVNNPIYYQENPETRPEHLTFSPRRQSLNDYLYQPSHQFARGASSYEALAPEQQGTMRRCESCHNFESTHTWLPYRERHIQSMTCESCHIPYMYAPARRVMDWTVLDTLGEPRMECRGFDGPPKQVTTLIDGFEPVLLPRFEADGSTRYAPYNLITFWYWTYGDPARPVRLADLKGAFFEDGQYRPELFQLLDQNGNGRLEGSELVLNTEKKVKAIRQQLVDLGLQNVRLDSEIQPFAIHHTVTHGNWVTRDCESCHHSDSKLSRSFLLAEFVPRGELPQFVGDTNALPAGRIHQKNGVLVYENNVQQAGFFILGHDSIFWVQVLGAASVIFVVLAITAHGGLRVITARRRRHERGPKKTVYIYSLYERFWHWLQAIAIIGLIFTGLIIHAPDVFGIISFAAAVYVHNALAFILLVNAFLAVFYHFASGAIRRFIPQPHGFFSQAMQQTTYYIKGIFRGEPHPFEKNPEVRLNPLQKITYLVILNVLLPLQIITGALIWGAQHFPDFLQEIGDLTLLVPFHSLIAWFFAAFLIAHIYLTTTGYTPLAAIKAMIVGWEDIETHEETV